MQVCAKCGHEIPEKTGSCARCDPALSAICPDCARPVKKNAKYCEDCGFVFSSVKGKPAQRKRIRKKRKSGARESVKPIGAKTKALKTCPECEQQIAKAARACPSCGLIFYTQPAKPVRTAPVSRAPAPSPATTRGLIAKIMVLVILTIMAALTAYQHPRVRILAGQLKRSSQKPQLLNAVHSNTQLFDLAIALPDPPWGILWNGREFLIGSNDKFLGFWNLSHVGDSLKAGLTPYRGTSDPEVFGIRPLTWNGRELIGYSETGIVQWVRKYQLTVQDPSTLKILKTYRSPDRIGGLAWDGAGYWAATWSDERMNSGYLYRLDRNFKVIHKMVSPSVRCTGLAWDGSFLWFIDDLLHKVYVLDVKGVTIQTIRSYDTAIHSSSGIAFDGKNVWICDSDEKRLYRFSSSQTPLLTQKKIKRPADKLSPQVVQTANTARFRGSNKHPISDAEVNNFYVEIIADTLYGSWNIHVGDHLLSAGPRPKQSKLNSYARYTVTVDGGTLASPIARVFEAGPGQNAVANEPLASSLGPGNYNVCLFVYIQYWDEQRTGRILTKTIPRLEVKN